MRNYAGILILIFFLQSGFSKSVHKNGPAQKSDSLQSADTITTAKSGKHATSIRFSQQDYETSINSIIDSLKRNHNCLECRAQLENGLIFLLGKGDYEKVFTLTDSAEQQGWSFRKMHRLRGEVLVQLEEIVRAEIELSKALSLNDTSIGAQNERMVNADDPCILYNRAMVRTMQGKFAGALRDIDKAIQSDGSSADTSCNVSVSARVMRAQVFYNLTNPSWSLSRTILEDMRNYAEGMQNALGKYLVMFIKGACLDVVEDNKSAVETLKPLLDIEDEELGNLHPMLVKVIYYSALIDLLIEEEKMDSVLAVAKTAQELMPNVPVMQTTRYNISWVQGKFDKAIEHKGIIDKQFPQSTSMTYASQARAMAQAGKISGARQLIDSALYYDSTSIKAHIVKAEVYIAAKDFVKAASAVAQVRSIDSKDPRVDMCEALLCAAQKKQQEAMALIKTAYGRGLRDNDKTVRNFKQFSEIKKSKEYSDFVSNAK